MACGKCHIGAEWDGQKWLLEFSSRQYQSENETALPMVSPREEFSFPFGYS